MSKLKQLLNIYWLPILFILIGFFASVVSFYMGHQTLIQRPNSFGLLLILFCYFSTTALRQKELRLFLSSTGLLLASFKVWWFFTADLNDGNLASWFENPWTMDFANLPLNFALGSIGFFIFQIYAEFAGSLRNRRLWTGILCTLIFSFVSFGVLRFFFQNGEGFTLYSLARVQPFDAVCIQIVAAFCVLRAWLGLFRHWKLYRASLAISALGGIILAVFTTGIERQVYTLTNDQMQRKIVDIRASFKNNVDERLSIISIFGDFINTVPNPTESQIYGMMNKLNSTGMDTPHVLLFDQNLNLKWMYRNKKFVWGAEAEKEVGPRKDTVVRYLQNLATGPQYLSSQTSQGLAISFTSTLIKNKQVTGHLVFEDLVEPRLKAFFEMNNFGPFEVTVSTADGTPLIDTSKYFKPGLRMTSELEFVGLPLHLTVFPARAYAINSIFIPQFAFLAVGLLLISVLIYTIYINRKRVIDIEKEVQDRTRDMKILKEEADRAKMIAEQASYSKSQFLANMSHEIRTPLNVLLGASELLAETNLDLEQKKFVDMFQTSGKHLLGLLNDIIDLSRIESGQLETEKIPFDLLKTLDFIRKLFELKAQEEGLNFVVQTLNLKDPIRLGDPLRIRQILVNLIGNSFKFTKKGTIRLTVTSVNESSIEFVVEDTGVGIPLEKQSEIFETFQQGDVSFSRKHGGAGLGLAITRNLCELMGGKIELQSKPDSGSQFIVTIPLPVTTKSPLAVDNPDVTPLLSKKEDHESSASKKKILIVDDSEDNRFLVKLFLENSKYQITEAKNGEEAVEFVRNQSYDVILMDMQMPVMDGYEAVKAIRHFEEGLDVKVPIIALTAHGTSLEKNKCLEIGCTDFLSKPVSKNLLLHRISELILN